MLLQVNELMETYKEKKCRNVNDYNIFMRFLMCVIIFDHFQRPKVATHMLLREFIHAKIADNGSTVIFVSEHKTAASGPAQVSIDHDRYKQFKLYLQQ